MAPINEKIEQAETVYKETLKRLIALEKKIKARKLPEDQERDLMSELAEVRKRLADHETHIHHLKTHSRRFFVLMVTFMGVCCALFMIYVLVFGPPLAGETEPETIDITSNTRPI